MTQSLKKRGIPTNPKRMPSHICVQVGNWEILGKTLLFFILVLWLSGCGLFGKENLKEWVGFHREEVIRVMGPPTKETSLPDGTTKLDFMQRITKHPSAAQQYGASYVCHRTFIIDPEGFVIDAWKEGC